MVLVKVAEGGFIKTRKLEKHASTGGIDYLISSSSLWFQNNAEA